MGDIPMTDIVFRQPSSNTPTSDNCDLNPGESQSTVNNNQSHEENSHSSTTIGLGPLRNALTLTIKQRIRAFDIISLCTGCEVSANIICRYEVSYIYNLILFQKISIAGNSF